MALEPGFPGSAECIDLLRLASHPDGFLASPALDHYSAVWTRDAAISSLGAIATDDPQLREVAAASLRTMAAHASPLGRVADAYWPARAYADWGEAGATDASAWFVVALAAYVGRFSDGEFARELWPAARRAFAWLSYQDVTGWGVIDSPAAGDWMDSSLNRSGKVLYVNALYVWAARGLATIGSILDEPVAVDPEGLLARVERFFWPRSGDDLGGLVEGTSAGAGMPHPLSAAEFRRAAKEGRRHYLASVSYGRWIDRCDVLANLLMVLLGTDRGETILDYLDDVGATEPYPTRSWPDAFVPGEQPSLFDPVADGLQHHRWRNPPGSYHNGAVWPYVGGFHAAALARAGRIDVAIEILERTAAANRLGEGFHEWIHAGTGQPSGASGQAWNAGAFLWAVAQVQRGEITEQA